MSTWQILTWFKNKTPTFFTFQNFYNKYWDINNFIYCIGYTSKENKQYILNNYFNKLEETRNIKYGNLLPLLVMDVENDNWGLVMGKSIGFFSIRHQ